MGKYYLYTHYRIDKDEIFYVGIGTKNKQDIKYSSYTRAYNKNKRNNYWKNIVKKSDYLIEIVKESDDYEEIKIEEVRLILLIGRKDLNLGSLCNMTNGGDGNINRIWTNESKLKASKSHKGKILTDEHIINIKKHLYGNKSHSGRNFSEEHRNNLSNAGKGRIAWNKDIKLSKESIDLIKIGIEENSKKCECGILVDSGNYTKWHGEKCEIVKIKDKIDIIQKMYLDGYNLYKISNILNIKYTILIRLRDNKIIKK